ncbi:DNA methyltransferase [Proteiniphilum sp.]|uniref:Eco57I restriction-modification methylase domain-containing protein n=1 Tax=Proteiniphilum sp. TaxID=1926877 RepID=UPI0033266113
MALINPDAIYLFNDQPLILFFDLSDNTNTIREEEIHKKIWSFDNSPIAFIVKNDEIKIYNALNYLKEEKQLEELQLDNETIIERFSFWNIQSSKFWKWFQEEYIENNRKKETKKRANERLFQNIKDVRNALIDRESDPEGSIPNSLILRLIFIRYLIDRNVEIDENFIRGEDIHARRASFSNLIRDYDRLSQLFTILNSRFNGVLFKDVDIDLTPVQAEALSRVFSGEIPEEGTLFYGNDFYFDIFDFSIIPVEVISGIYESLIDPETRDLQSAVYTPSFLANYILNDTVDVYLEQHNVSECKIFEVAVGSGVFLVQSLRRMIEKEIELHGNADNKVFSERIREIAKRTLYGIDINKEALKVTCFSIYIALLDYQKPKNISIYQFPTLLDENLFEANFFDTKHLFNQVIKSIKPGYILGNPPWKSSKDECHVEWLKTKKKTVGGFEIAQSFLLRTQDFMDDKTKAALIVTSTIFYNVSRTTRIFRKEFLTTYCLTKFFDLSPVRRLIFEEKNSPASVVYFQLSRGDSYVENMVNHQSVKMNYFLKHFKIFVIEKFDRKMIPQRLFLENDWMFKIALYGNTLDFNFIKRLNEKGNRLHDKLNNCAKGAGILSGKKEDYPLYRQIVGKDLLLNGQVKRYFSSAGTPQNVSEEKAYLKSGKIAHLYEGHQILFKEQTKDESSLAVSLVDKPYVFKKGIFGISSFDYEEIKSLYALFISNLYTYYMYAVSGSWGTSTRPQIRWKDEYLSFPFIEPDLPIKNKLSILVDKFIAPYKEFYTQFNMGEPFENVLILSQIDDIINELYGIREYEKDLIDYVLNVSIYQFQESKTNLITDFTSGDETHYRNRKFVMERYAEVYLQEFEKIYSNEHLQAEVYILDHFIAMNFVFHAEKVDKKIIFPKEKNEFEVLERLADNLGISEVASTTDPEKNLFIQKDIKGFDKNSFYIIKPNEYKSWHRAMAWYDIAEFKSKIEEAELTAHLNDKENE